MGKSVRYYILSTIFILGMIVAGLAVLPSFASQLGYLLLLDK